MKLHRIRPATMAVLAFVFAAIAVPCVAAQNKPVPWGGEYEASLVQRMAAFPPAVQQGMLIMAWAKVNTEAKNIETDTGEKMLDALKIRAIAARMMRSFADQIEWAEGDRLFGDLSDIYVDTIRGKASTKGADVRAAEWDTHWRAMVKRVQRAAGSAMPGPAPDELLTIVDDVGSFVGGGGVRLYVWGRGPDRQP